MNRRNLDTAGRRRRWPYVIATLLVVVAGSAVAVAADASTPSHKPVGHLNSVTQSGNGIALVGWAYDADAAGPVTVDITVDGHGRAKLAADAYRPSIAKAQPSYGTHRGFVAQLAEPAGRHTVCAYAINAPSKKHNPLLDCRRITVNFDPLGTIDSIKQSPGKVTVTGWTLDPDQPAASRPISLRVDGVVKATGTANLTRSDVAKSHPGAGSKHGYSLTIPVTEGKHTFCVKAKNAGLGSNNTFACRAQTISFSPSGAITTLIQKPGGFRVYGWATDPDTSAPVKVTVTADGVTYGSFVADGSVTGHTGHGFRATYKLNGTKLAPGKHTVCATATNAGAYGKDTVIGCRTITLNFNPRAGVESAAQQSPGAHIVGWASDPDTSAPIKARITADGKTVSTVTANATGGTHSGHQVVATAPLANGKHSVCIVALNTAYGSADSAPACATVTLDFNPAGKYESVQRAPGSSSVLVTGWAIDPDTSKPIQVRVIMGGKSQLVASADVTRTDVAKAHPGTGTAHGFALTVPANAAEHTVCVTALNVAGGTGDTSLGCKVINAVHPKAPSAPTAVTATGGYGGASVTWKAPASDGGAPWTSYVATSSPGGIKTTAGASATTATVIGLKAKTKYTFKVSARNVAGTSAAGVSPAVATQASPPPQKTPAPVSTSRYIRNIHGSTAKDLNTMRVEGATDASYNPSGHGYLVLLDIGGQDQYDGGVVLSATTRFISYGDLAKNIKAYVDGYHSKQKASAPVTIAIGTNNDMEVTAKAGAAWANSVIDPIRSYASKYTGITIAGANDIEPGFRGTYKQTSAWLNGYLGATSAAFVFNGSADGCAWTKTNRGCNNGWSMAGLYHLAAGAAPIRTVNLPQIYNATMAAQWKYISLTGVAAKQPRINFGGALTEWTACDQANGCYSLTGHNAWKELWSQLQSASQLKVGSLPYSTDLRIDK